MTTLSRINSSLMNQVSHGTLIRLFDHAEAAAGRADGIPWGYFGGQGVPLPVYELKTKTGV